MVVNKCTKEYDPICEFSEKEVDEYFADMTLMTLFNDNYLTYDDPNRPLKSRVNWGSSKLNSKSFKMEVFSVKLDTFESYDDRISFTGQK